MFSFLRNRRGVYFPGVPSFNVKSPSQPPPSSATPEELENLMNSRDSAELRKKLWAELFHFTPQKIYMRLTEAYKNNRPAEIYNLIEFTEEKINDHGYHLILQGVLDEAFPFILENLERWSEIYRRGAFRIIEGAPYSPALGMQCAMNTTYLMARVLGSNSVSRKVCCEKITSILPALRMFMEIQVTAKHYYFGCVRDEAVTMLCYILIGSKQTAMDAVCDHGILEVCLAGLEPEKSSPEFMEQALRVVLMCAEMSEKSRKKLFGPLKAIDVVKKLSKSRHRYAREVEDMYEITLCCLEELVASPNPGSFPDPQSKTAWLSNGLGLTNELRETVNNGSRIYCSNSKCSKEEGKQKFKVCARCKRTRYCSKECQLTHWKDSHRDACVKPVH